MELLQQAIDFVLHLDVHLADMTARYGTATYAILFAIVFCETGLVVTPFLPGDSLLFAAGALAALPGSALEVGWVYLLLTVAAVLGDSVNYAIGQRIGRRAFSGRIRFLKQEHLDRTHAFYEKYGAKTIVIARFVPIVRTFAPFVAGVGSMTYGKFLTYNVVGALLWCTSLIFAGYFFAETRLVKENFSLVIVAIIVLSMVPIAVEFLRARRAGRAPTAPGD